MEIVHCVTRASVMIAAAIRLTLIPNRRACRKPKPPAHARVAERPAAEPHKERMERSLTYGMPYQRRNVQEMERRGDVISDDTDDGIRLVLTE